MSRLARRPDALWRRTADGIVVLGAASSEARAVNGPAAELWDLLAAPTDEHEAIETLANAHGAAPGVVARDVAAVLEAWLEDGALERVP